jgi:hypothetical protein
MNYAIYEISTGKIKTIGSCMAKAFNLQKPTKVELGLIDLPEKSWNYWVDTSVTPHAVVEKNQLNYSLNKTEVVADGVDSIVISGLVNPITVTWPDGEITEVTDGEIEFSIDLLGEYTVKLETLKHYTEVVNVTAVNPS